MSEWLDRLAADLLYVEGELRAALLAIRRGRAPHPRTRMAGPGANPAAFAGLPSITIHPNEARTLIRGAMPAPIAGSRLRRPHARMVAALHIFGQHLLALNSPTHPRGAALAAAADLADALAAWQHAARWQDATTRAGSSWQFPITAIIGRPTHPPAAQTWNIDLPNAAAGRLNHPGAALREVYRRRASPDLSTPAEPADLRQLPLPLHPVPLRAAPRHAA